MSKKKLTNGLYAQVQTDDARKALRRVLRVVERKGTMPAISAVLLDGLANEMTFSAFDLEIGLNSRHGAEIERKGRVALPAKLLKDIIDRAPERVVEFEALENNGVRIVSGSMESELGGLSPDDITLPPVPESMRFAATDVSAFSALIAGVKAAMSSDETRFNLCGAILEKTRAGWRMVATDGHRLAALERAIEEAHRKAVDERVFIGHKALETMLAILLEDESISGELGFNKSTVVFKRPDLDIIARLQEDNFPDWAQVVPKETKHSVVLPRVAFTEAIKRMQPIATEIGEKIVLHLGKNVLKLRAEASNAGTVTDRMTVDHTGADVTIAASAKYLLDALDALNVDQVNLGLEDSISPVVLRPVGDESRSVWVVMPMRVEVADQQAISGDDVESVFAPFRKVWADQTTKNVHMEQARKLGRDAARLERKTKGGPLEKGEMAWPKAGFWTTAEDFAKRTIPEDEREVARETFWLEATKPWPAGEATRAQIEEVERMGKKSGEAMLKAMEGNRLTLSDRRGKAWPEPKFVESAERELKRKLTDDEIDCMREAYYDACAVEDAGDEVKPDLKVVKDGDGK